MRLCVTHRYPRHCHRSVPRHGHAERIEQHTVRVLSYRCAAAKQTPLRPPTAPIHSMHPCETHRSLAMVRGHTAPYIRPTATFVSRRTCFLTTHKISAADPQVNRHQASLIRTLVTAGPHPRSAARIPFRISRKLNSAPTLHLRFAQHPLQRAPRLLYILDHSCAFSATKAV